MFSGGSHPNWLAHRHDNVILPPPGELFSSFPMPSTQQPYSGQAPQSLFPIKETLNPGYGGLFPPQLPGQAATSAPGRTEDYPAATSVGDLQWTPWPGHPLHTKTAAFPPANGLPPFSNTTVTHAYGNMSNGYGGYPQRNAHSPYPARNTQSPYSARNAHSPYSQSSHSPYPARNAQSPYSRNAHSPYGSRNAQSPYSMTAHSPYSSHNSPSPYSGQSGHSPGYSKQTMSDNDFQLMLGGAFLGTRLSSEIADANSAQHGGVMHNPDGSLKDPTKRLSHLPPHPAVRATNVVGSPQAKPLDDQGRLSHPNVMNFDPRTSHAPTMVTPTGSTGSVEQGISQKNNFLPNSPQKLTHPAPAPANFSPPKNMTNMVPFPPPNNSPAPAPACSVASKESANYSGNFSSDPGTPHSVTSQMSYEENPQAQPPPQSQEQVTTNVPVSQSFSETTPLSHEFKETPESTQEFKDFKDDQNQNLSHDFNEGQPVSQGFAEKFGDNQSVSHQSHEFNERPLSQGYVENQQQQQQQQQQQPVSQAFDNQQQPVSQSFSEDNVNQAFSDNQPLSQSDSDTLSFGDGSSLSQSFNGTPQSFHGNMENGTMPQTGPLGPSGPMAHAVSIAQNFPETNTLTQNFDLGRQPSPNLALMSNYNENPSFMTPSYAGSESHDSFPDDSDVPFTPNDLPFPPNEVQFTPKKVEAPVKGKKSKKLSQRTPRKDDALIEIKGFVEDARRVRGAKGTLTPEEVFEYLGQKTSVCSFQCHYEACKERFSDVAVYIQHCLQQHQAYICHECGKDFTTKSSLLRHRHIHTGLHRFACSICKKTFYRKDKCRAHIKRHLMEGNNKGAVEDVCVPAPPRK